MGTRNLTLVFHNGDYRVAQYGQWDGYPSGQGATVIQFIHDRNSADDWADFFVQLGRCSFLTAEQEQALDKQLKATDEPLDSINPYITRNHGARILQLIHDSPHHPIELQDSRAFAATGLFCEYAYLIDLDSGTLEMYVGFNQDLTRCVGRFADLDGEDSYTPITLVGTWPLDKPPTVKDMEDAETTFRGDDT